MKTEILTCPQCGSKNIQTDTSLHVCLDCGYKWGNSLSNNRGEIVIYESHDGVRLDVRLENETVWLTLEQMSLLFNKSRSTINEHILHIYEEGELNEDKTKRKIGISDFSTKPTNLYNLDVIISVGYRGKSL